MYRITFSILATVIMLAAGRANAADQDRTEQMKEETEKSVGNSSKDEAYLAAVKKCEGAAAKEKQRCIESAKERYGEMLR